MINSKLRAYKYDNGWEEVSRWDLIDLSEADRKKYRSQHFPLYLSKSLDSPKLTFNIRQKTFRYYPNQGLDENSVHQGMTISHQLAQEVLSNIRTMHLNLIDKRTKPYKKDIQYTIEVEKVFQEWPIKVGNGRRADLLVTFSKPEELALKWNGFFVLEVFVTHEVEGDKIMEFQKGKVPLIEIELGPSLLRKKTAARTSRHDEEHLRHYMNNVFRKQIRGILWSDPSSKAYLESEAVQDLYKKLDEAEGQIKVLTMQNLSQQERLDVTMEELKERDRELERIRRDLAHEKKKVKSLMFRLKEIRSRSTWQKFIDLFKK